MIFLRLYFSYSHIGAILWNSTTVVSCGGGVFSGGTFNDRGVLESTENRTTWKSGRTQAMQRKYSWRICVLLETQLRTVDFSLCAVLVTTIHSVVCDVMEGQLGVRERWCPWERWAWNSLPRAVGTSLCCWRSRSAWTALSEGGYEIWMVLCGARGWTQWSLQASSNLSDCMNRG